MARKLPESGEKLKRVARSTGTVVVLSARLYESDPEFPWETTCFGPPGGRGAARGLRCSRDPAGRYGVALAP